MAQQTIENGVTFGINRGRLNANFSELYSIKVEASQVLIKTNTVPFTPTADYHPATKVYIDQALSTWTTIYDPQAINADTFDRANHTGTQLPATIATDASNRFVTDAQITDWNQKEDNIGTKGTAFNKNFGTTTGTVAYGDHIHTKADIGLGNVDNTSDADKPVSTATAAAILAHTDDTDNPHETTSADLINSIVTKTTDYTVTAADSTIIADATSNAVTIGLITAVGNTGKKFTIKCIDETFPVDIETNGSETIDKSTDNFPLYEMESITVQSDGSNYFIIY